MIEINTLHKLLVKVNEGSGILLKFETLNKCYVLTAYHCIKDSIMNQELIELSNDNNESYLCIKYYIDIPTDIALLEINCIDSIDSIKYCNNISPGDGIIFMGYPDKGQGKRKSLNGNIIEWNATKTSVNVIENIQASVMENERTDEVIVGFSGSAVFKKDEQKIFLIGVIKSLPEKDFDYKEIDCISIEKILGFINKEGLGNLESITVDNINRDTLASKNWDKLNRQDNRNLRDKLKDACLEITDTRVNKYINDVCLGKDEQMTYDEQDISAIKFNIFNKCQEELLSFYEDNLETENLTIQEVRIFMEKYLITARLAINDRSISYTYLKISDDLITKIILDLIDECYLSFDKDGIYEH